jgi:glycosyltransferase involved in cell wall biosynthesis
MPIRVLELRSVAGTGGGPEKTILAGAQRVNPNILMTVCYVCNEGDEVFPIGEQARKLGIDYAEIRERRTIDWRAWQALRQLVRAKQIDIVHGHDYKTNLMAYWLSRVEPVIPLSTAHGYTGHGWKERRIYYPADKRLLARFPKVVTVSGELKRTLVKAGADPNRIDVILNGIDPQRFRRDPGRRDAARARYALTSGDVAIGSVGRLEPQKRFDLLIDAFASLSRTSPALRLLIAGEGSRRDTLQIQIDRLGLGQRCRLVGQADVTEFHHALDLFVQSSDYEGTPNVVLEAMAFETPFVATDVGGTGELFTDQVHGILIPPGDAKVLADAIARALADPVAARTRVEAARKRVETDLSFARWLETIDRVCEQLFESQSARRLPKPPGSH